MCVCVCVRSVQSWDGGFSGGRSKHNKQGTHTQTDTHMSITNKCFTSEKSSTRMNVKTQISISGSPHHILHTPHTHTQHTHTHIHSTLPVDSARLTILPVG